MNKIFKIALLFIIVAGSFGSCIDDSYNHITDSSLFNPTYSLPITHQSFSPAGLFAEMIPVDTTGLADTIPLIWFDDNFYIDSIGYIDTTLIAPFTFTFLNQNTEIIKSIMIRVNYANGFPSNGFLQVYFMDAGYNVLDSLYKPDRFYIEVAPVDLNGVVTGISIGQRDAYLAKEDLPMLQQVAFLAFNIYLDTQTSSSGYLKYFSDYQFNLQMATRVELETSLGN